MPPFMPDEDKNFRIFNFRFWKVMMSRENDLYKLITNQRGLVYCKI